MNSILKEIYVGLCSPEYVLHNKRDIGKIIELLSSRPFYSANDTLGFLIKYRPEIELKV